MDVFQFEEFVASSNSRAASARWTAFKLFIEDIIPIDYLFSCSLPNLAIALEIIKIL